MHSYDYILDLLYFLIKRKYYDWNKQNNNAQLNNNFVRKDINADFYEGFTD